MQAIVTKFVPPTNTKPSRISAQVQARRIVLAWDHSFDANENHNRAALALVRRMGWVPEQGVAYAGRWVAGDLPNGNRVYSLASADARWADGFDIQAEA